PKPAVPLVNRPLGAYSMERLAALGVTRCAVNLHHLADAAVAELSAHRPPSLELTFVREATLLGTGGGLRNAVERALAEQPDPGPVVVMNGDIVFWPDLEGALALHRSLGALATMVVRADPRARQLGAIETDSEGRVRRLLGAPAEVAGPLSEWMFTGVHVLELDAVRSLPKEGCVIRQGYRRWVDDGAVVGGFPDGSAWRDLGTKEAYLAAHVELLDGSLRWPGRALEAVSPEARVEGAELDRTAVGAGATIEPGVRLSRCVVWPGTHVRASAEESILTPTHTLSVG
ncbi:MAG: NDP-sugar synthase, partial [Sandaracinaceae bacterium]